MAIAAFLLLLWGVPVISPGQQQAMTPATPVPAGAQEPDAQEPGAGEAPGIGQTPATGRPTNQAADTGGTRESVEEATGTIRTLAAGIYRLLPKLAIAAGLLILAGLLIHFVRPVLRRILSNWEKAEALTALVGVLIWLVALGAALSVIAGDARALLGSVGLFGLALSWALQTPIESFTGWLINSFKSYYRIGDRIAVGQVFGDVYKIDFLTTTVWEAGGPEKQVLGEQPTGALITFPNAEVLRANIINFTRLFPYVWDEVTVNVANESDLAYTSRVFERVAREVLGETMAASAARYRAMLRDAGLDYDIATEARVFFAPAESWTDATIRYLVPVRERRHWSSALVEALSAELAKPEHRGRLAIGYPRARIEWVGDTSRPARDDHSTR